MNYWKTARDHGIEERAVDVHFIQEYSKKLAKVLILIRKSIRKPFQMLSMIG